MVGWARGLTIGVGQPGRLYPGKFRLPQKTCPNGRGTAFRYMVLRLPSETICAWVLRDRKRRNYPVAGKMGEPGILRPYLPNRTPMFRWVSVFRWEATEAGNARAYLNAGVGKYVGNLPESGNNQANSMDGGGLPLRQI